MRKILYFLTSLLCIQGAFVYALKDCSDLQEDYDSLKGQVTHSMDEWRAMSDTDPNKALHGKALSDLLTRGVKVENDYNDCLNSIKKVNDLIQTYFDL